MDKSLELSIAYVPQNDKLIIENIIKSNIYRKDERISNNLSILLHNITSKSQQWFTKLIEIIERIFDELDEQYKAI